MHKTMTQWTVFLIAVVIQLTAAQQTFSGRSNKAVRNVDESRTTTTGDRILAQVLLTMSQLEKDMTSLKSTVAELKSDVSKTAQQMTAQSNDLKWVKSRMQYGATSYKPRDCTDVLHAGFATSGVYTIYVGRPLRPIQVYCDMTTDGGGWLVFQRRQDGSQNFYRGWTDYAAGYGNLTGEFWLGNVNFFLLTNAGKKQRMRVDLADFEENTRYAEYSNFRIGSPAQKYKMSSLGTYSGNAGDGLPAWYYLGLKFSTKDNDNDDYKDPNHHSAQKYKGAWWYAHGHYSHLNGLYSKGKTTRYAQSVEWQPWHGHYYSLKFSEMKLRPADA